MGFLTRLLKSIFGTNSSTTTSNALVMDWDQKEMALRLSTCKRRNIRDKTYIYGLYNHGTRRVFYVGRTSDLHRRWREHIKSANPNGTFKERYIDWMLSENQPPHDIPAMVILEECNIYDSKSREKFWTAKFKVQATMTNQKIG